jgi:hypothetical protein
MVNEQAVDLPLVDEPLPGSSPGSATRCAACGSCCRVLSLQGSHDSYRLLLEQFPERLSPDQRLNAAFILAHMHPIGPALALQINPMLAMKDIHANFYLCDRYEAVSQRCLAYDERPPVCSGFPKYNRPLTDAQYASGLSPHPRCSFWADVPKDLWPDYVDPLPSPVSVC